MIIEWHHKEYCGWFFCNLLGINTHDVVKNHPNFENKSMFYAKFCGVDYKILFSSEKCNVWGLGLETSL